MLLEASLPLFQLIIMHPFLTFGPLQFPCYGIMILLGIIAGTILLIVTQKVKHVHLSGLYIFLATLLSLIMAFIGSYLWDHLSHFLNGEGWHGGVSVMGGIVLGFPTFIFFTHWYYQKWDAVRYLIDAFIPSFTLGHAFGRIGCLLGGCCYGAPSRIGFGFIYPEGSLAVETYGANVILIPAPLYEAIFLVILTVVFLTFLKRRRIVYYLLMYGVWRYFSEAFLRGDNRGTFIPGIMSSAEFISLLMIILAIVLFIVIKKKNIRGYDTALVASCLLLKKKKLLKRKPKEANASGGGENYESN